MALNLEDKGGNQHYNFVVSKLRAEISSKERGNKKGCVEIEDLGILYTCIEASRKFHANLVCFFKLFFGDKKEQFLKALHSPSYGSNLRKRYTKYYTIVDMSIEGECCGSCPVWKADK